MHYQTLLAELPPFTIGAIGVIRSIFSKGICLIGKENMPMSVSWKFTSARHTDHTYAMSAVSWARWAMGWETPTTGR